MTIDILRAQTIERLTRVPIAEVMAEADALRRTLHPAPEVTFVVDTNPNYTNVCITDCTFCSFYRKPSDADAYSLAPQELADRVEAAHAKGATTALIQGGHHPDLGWPDARRLIEAVRERLPEIHVHPFSPSEIHHFAANSGLTVDAVLADLWALGIRSMPGGGAEILVDRVRRRISPKKLGAAQWLDLMRKAHRIGFKTSATMTYGHVESLEDVVDHLLALRALQQETGGFYAFIPWSFKPGQSPLAKLVKTTASAALYLRIIAVARLVLADIPHIQASWFGEGVRAGQLALFAGADDFGGVLLEENVLREADHALATSIDSVIGMIRQVGFTPVKRTTLYERIRAYPPGTAASSSDDHREFVVRRQQPIPIRSLPTEPRP